MSQTLMYLQLPYTINKQITQRKFNFTTQNEEKNLCKT
ncbi:hypothetical protein SPWS13_0423 [Shewanella putrefaciens]|nr:hypothetical protein SPWS13_0423 [Shewanella putrefaciens]